MKEKTLFIESLTNHQRLIDVLLEHKNVEGICVISEEELSIAMNRSWGWIKKAICRINTEDLCVERIATNRYRVHYKNLLEQGVFFLIAKMIINIAYNPYMLHWKNDELMQKFGCTLKTVQMYRAYCTTGWIQGTAGEENSNT